MPHRRKYNCSLSFQDHKEAVSARDSPSEALVIHADLSLEVLASEPGSLFGAGPALGNVEATYSAPVQLSGRVKRYCATPTIAAIVAMRSLITSTVGLCLLPASAESKDVCACSTLRPSPVMP
jgi:hypothetical protein